MLCIYGAVRGVGGIDSWGTDVEDAYHISAEKDIDYSSISADKEGHSISFSISDAERYV